MQGIHRLSFRRSVVALLLVAILAAAAIAYTQRDPVGLRQIWKLKPYMEEFEVRRILGEPTPILVADEPRWLVVFSKPPTNDSKAVSTIGESWFAEEWRGKSRRVRILFDEERRLRAHYTDATGEPDFVEGVLFRFGL